MILSELSPGDALVRIRHGRLQLRVGPFLVRLGSPFSDVAAYVRSHYRDFPVVEEAGSHFAVAVRPPRTLRRYLRPQCLLLADGATPFRPLPRRLAPGVLEWGMNWCIGRFAHHWLVLHSAVVERHGKALLLPAPPGSGKSTLCAALAFGGWRLLSDEFAITHLASATVLPLPRPIALKGRAIDVMTRRVPSLRLGPELEDTDGARARHVAPLASAVQRASEPATPAWIVVPTYRAGAATALESVPRGRMLAHLADSSFNYNIVGDAGFARLADMVDRCQCFTLTYSNLDEAVDLCDGLAAPASQAP